MNTPSPAPQSPGSQPGTLDNHNKDCAFTAASKTAGLGVVQFFAAGDPIPQPRPRAFARRFGSVYQARIYNPSTAEGWKNCIAAAAQTHIPPAPWLCPVCCELTFYFSRPQSHFGSGKNAEKLKPNAPRWHTAKRGDRDNMDKAVLDTLTILGFWKDDSQVCDGWIKKLWCPVGLRPGVQVTITAIEEAPEETGLETNKVERREPSGVLELFEQQKGVR